MRLQKPTGQSSQIHAVPIPKDGWGRHTWGICSPAQPLSKRRRRRFEMPASTPDVDVEQDADKIGRVFVDHLRHVLAPMKKGASPHRGLAPGGNE
jgi:hypothetical protein